MPADYYCKTCNDTFLAEAPVGAVSNSAKPILFPNCPTCGGHFDVCLQTTMMVGAAKVVAHKPSGIWGQKPVIKPSVFVPPKSPAQRLYEKQRGSQIKAVLNTINIAIPKKALAPVEVDTPHGKVTECLYPNGTNHHAPLWAIRQAGIDWVGQGENRTFRDPCVKTYSGGRRVANFVRTFKENSKIEHNYHIYEPKPAK
jgi:hypothetical protein